MNSEKEIANLSLNENKLRKWLKKYGATDQEINNFITDIQNDIEDKLDEFDEDKDWDDYLDKEE